jgi:SpoVK/Ycf46/Vps4 family AAA+-type ATPase
LASWQSITSDQQATDFASRWLIDRSCIETLIRRIDKSSRSSENLLEKISGARLAAAPPNLLDLAFHVSMPVNSDSVILQKRVENDLQSLFHRCLQREKIFSGLGGNLGQQTSAGVKALFSGESGTGKTLAATVLAHQLGIPLYRLDLGSILNKYVGETEKNIHKLLEQIAAEDYILLIDEADALFGKRTDAESGGERFANMLTNYLLARIEQHQGIVLMTTNGLGRIDPAFMRRFDKVIEFLPPEFDERMAIWKSLLGERNPGDAYCRQLASLCELSGGFIRNAVLSAAAEVGYQQKKIIPYSNLLSCLAREYIKSGKPIPPKLTQLLSQQLAQQLSLQPGNKEGNLKDAVI